MLTPPLSAGAVHEMVADPSPEVAVTLVGAAGAVVATVMLADDVDGELVPAAFVAVTLKV